jgi:hypothetical protein
MTAIRERPEFQRGRQGEHVVAAWLKQRGCFVIPSYDYSGEDGDKAPLLQGLWEGYPVPDLDVARNGNRFWVEVKTKERPVEWRKTGELRHGIELRLLQHYRTVQTISGSPCWLFIYEESTRWLLAQTLGQLGQPSIGTDRGTPMAYWARVCFRELDRIPAPTGKAPRPDNREALPHHSPNHKEARPV